MGDYGLLHPPSMLGAIRSQLTATGQRLPESPIDVARVVFDSLALGYARVIAAIERLTGEPIAGIHVVGGGARNAYLNQATADATGKPVLAGPVEATATGNVIGQAVVAAAWRPSPKARPPSAAGRCAVRPGRLASLGEAARRLDV